MKQLAGKQIDMIQMFLSSYPIVKPVVRGVCKFGRYLTMLQCFIFVFISIQFFFTLKP